MAALGKVWVCLPWVPGATALIPVAWELETIAHAAGYPATHEGQALPSADLTASTPESTGEVQAGKLMPWKASLCDVQKIYLQKGSHIPAASALPGICDSLPQSPGESC